MQHLQLFKLLIVLGVSAPLTFALALALALAGENRIPFPLLSGVECLSVKDEFLPANCSIITQELGDRSSAFYKCEDGAGKYIVKLTDRSCIRLEYFHRVNHEAEVCELDLQCTVKHSVCGDGQGQNEKRHCECNSPPYSPSDDQQECLMDIWTTTEEATATKEREGCKDDECTPRPSTSEPLPARPITKSRATTKATATTEITPSPSEAVVHWHWHLVLLGICLGSAAGVVLTALTVWAVVSCFRSLRNTRAIVAAKKSDNSTYTAVPLEDQNLGGNVNVNTSTLKINFHV